MSSSISALQLAGLQARQFARRSSNWWVAVIFLGAGFYALYQGYAGKLARTTTIHAFRQEKDSLLHDLKAGLLADTTTREGKAKYLKSSLLNSALFNTRIPSWKLPVSTAIYNIGQSDVFTYYYLFGAENFEMQLLKQTEINNPLRALAGHFDVSFWLVYLLPLMILLFSFNALSAQTDNGNWRLIAAQGISEKQWLQSRFAIAGALSAALLALVAGMGLIINRTAFKQSPEWTDGLFLLAGLVYLVFWLSLFYLISSLRRPTAYNALLCGIAWIGFCLVVPVLVSKLAGAAIPVDNTTISTFSRRPQNPRIEADKAFAAGIIRQMAATDARYYKADTDSTKPAFYARVYQALHVLLHRQRWPLMQGYFGRIEKRQRVTDWSALVNPAGSTDGWLTALADNDAAAYHRFTEQTEGLQKALQDALYPSLFSDKLLSSHEYDRLPQFHYRRSGIPASLAGYFLFVIATSILLLRRAHQNLSLANCHQH